MLVNSNEMLKVAKAGKYAIPSPDFIDLTSLKAYIEVAEEFNMPVIISFAEAFFKESNLNLAEIANIGIFAAKNAKVDVCLHLDHGMNEETVYQAIDLGFSSVMIDASKKSFDENVAITKRVVEYAHKRNVSVEAEIGHVGSNDTVEASEEESIYTEVAEAAKFYELTKVDSLAVSIGTSHGLYKGTPKINFERLQELAANVKCPLVLHGGSSSGDDNLNRCSTNGITKINIFTDLIVAGLKEIQDNNPKDLFELNRLKTKGMKEMLAHYYNVFECVRKG